MKRQVQNWSTRKLPPLTVEELERHLDMLAGLMARAGKRAHLYLPVYRRVRHELEKKKGNDALLAEAMNRAALAGHTLTQSPA